MIMRPIHACGRILALSVLLGFGAVVAPAQGKIPALVAIPSILPEAEQEQMRKQAGELELAYAQFKKSSDLFNAKKPAEQSDAEFNALDAQRSAIIADRKFFNLTIGRRVRELLSETGPIPDLGQVAATLPDPLRAGFTQRRAELAGTIAGLKTRRADFEEHCHLAYSANESKACTGKAIQLVIDTEACMRAVKSLNWEIEQAFGEERIRLENLIRESDLALAKDANAVKQFGFDRRAEDFEKWARISEANKHLVVDKLVEQILETGADEMRQGIADQLLAADDAAIDGMLRKLQVLSLGASSSADVLRQYKANHDKSVLPALAKQINEDIRTVVKFDESYQLGNSGEAGLEALKFFLPPGPREAVSLVEVSAWATYGAGMQTVAVLEVKRLNELTAKELLALQKIRCLSERHVFARYEAKVKLAIHLGQDASALPKPVVSPACAQPDP